MPKGLRYAITLAGFAFLAWGGILALQGIGDMKIETGPMILIVLGLLASAAGVSWHIYNSESPKPETHTAAPLPTTSVEQSSGIADEKLPGIGIATVLTIKDALAARRKYVFSFQSPEGAVVSFYLSKDDVFKFSVKTVNDEFQILDIPLGTGGIPVYKPVYLVLDVGTASNYSFMRASLNGQTIIERKYPFRMDLGSRNWQQTHLNADEDGQRSGAVDLFELGRWPATFTREENLELTQNARQSYKF